MEHAIAVAFGSVNTRNRVFPPDHSAEIVDFPRSFASPAQNDAESFAQLQKAAEKLEAAASAQKAAVATWRSSLDGAAQSLEALEASMHRYDRSLTALDLSEITEKSRELAAIMDKVIAVKA